MATTTPAGTEGETLGLAYADLSAKQYYAVILTANGVELCSTAGGKFDGILQNAPIAGQACQVKRTGSTKAIGGAAIATIGSGLQVTAAGKLIALSNNNQYCGGRSKTACSADAAVFEANLAQEGFNSLS